VDARRNLESVLRAAREVFGELGYGAPMEEVARRAGVGVGTVYRRFPSKEVLVRRIASEEVVWLTQQAREALAAQSEGPGAWDALAAFLARAATSGAGRLLPPETFRQAEAMVRVPAQRGAAAPAATGSAGSADAATDEYGADADPANLLELLAQLVGCAREAGELRSGVMVSDVVLVLTASVPPHTSSDGSAAGRLLQLLLDGLRAV
jgi:AcrR family transcriptional regulator